MVGMSCLPGAGPGRERHGPRPGAHSNVHPGERGGIQGQRFACSSPWWWWCWVPWPGSLSRGWRRRPRAASTARTLDPFFTTGVSGITAVVGLVFVSFGGLTKVASAAEEVEDPSQRIPLGMALSLATATVVYTLGVLVDHRPGAARRTARRPGSHTHRSTGGPAEDRRVAGRGGGTGCLLLGGERGDLGRCPVPDGHGPRRPPACPHGGPQSVRYPGRRCCHDRDRLLPWSSWHSTSSPSPRWPAPSCS